MTCPKCKSESVTVQAVAITKNKGKGCIYWLIIGWWLEPLLWIFLTIPMLLCALFGGKRVKTKVKNVAVCQACGNRWNI